MPATLARFARHKTILLKTRRRDGAWVGTAVSIVVQGDHAYIRTYDKSWKSKRLANFPEVKGTSVFGASARSCSMQPPSAGLLPRRRTIHLSATNARARRP